MSKATEIGIGDIISHPTNGAGLVISVGQYAATTTYGDQIPFDGATIIRKAKEHERALLRASINLANPLEDAVDYVIAHFDDMAELAGNIADAETTFDEVMSIARDVITSGKSGGAQ